MFRYHLFVLLLFTSGCGSCLDNDTGLTGHVYGGVKADVQLFQRCVGWANNQDDNNTQVEKKSNVLLDTSFALFAVVDTPASFIVDTLLLPNAIYETYFRPKPPTIEDMLSELSGVR